MTSLWLMFLVCTIPTINKVLLTYLLYLLTYNEVIMSAMVSQITSLMIVYSTVYSRRISKKTSKLCVTGLCVGNSLLTVEFPAQRASDAENILIWWRHHDVITSHMILWYVITYACPTSPNTSCHSKDQQNTICPIMICTKFSVRPAFALMHNFHVNH